MLCLKTRFMVPFSSRETPLQEKPISKCFPILQADSDDFFLKLDGAPPHWHQMVRAFLNEKVPNDGLVGRGPKTFLFVLGLRDLQISPYVIFFLLLNRFMLFE